ncbi:MAG: hypothetical protein ACI9YB_001973 [Halioglobus sp.]
MSIDEEFSLGGFVSSTESGWWGWIPPFDVAGLASETRKKRFFRVSIEDLSFFLKKNN